MNGLGPNDNAGGVPLRVGVVGAAGYTGGALLDVLGSHGLVEVAAVFGRAEGEGGSSGSRVSDVHPRLADVIDLPIEPTSAIAQRALDALVLCTPHGVSADIVAELAAADAMPPAVLDLSGAFRLRDDAAHTRCYGFARPAGLPRAVYGLCERRTSEQLRAAGLIAVPGCYPTATALAIAPLLSAGLVDRTEPVLVTAVSGVSGAGRGARADTSFCEVGLRPYNVFCHRHEPEIAQEIGAAVTFVPQVAPFDRGIVSVVHARLADGVDASQIPATMAAAYADRRLVRVRTTAWPGVAEVAHTPFCDVRAEADGATRRIVAVGAIDNLLKGAASQAVQCMNIRFGFDEWFGLLPAARAGVVT